jgi:prepilin-type N-terminal cleavage/methylation domain-containing protein
MNQNLEIWAGETRFIMTIQKTRGFTLIELMMVTVLVAIMAAIVAPQLIDVNDRGNLDKVVNDTQKVIAFAKALAVKTRHAVVVEVRGDSIWVNTLQTNDCASKYRERCVMSAGDTKNAADTNVFRWDAPVYKASGVAMCDFRVASFGQTNTCDITTITLPGGGAGLCYNGSGQLFIRTSIDTASACGQTSDPSNSAIWTKACVPWVGSNNSDSANDFSGADIRFNRFESASGKCAADGSSLSPDVEGITRQILIPAGGHPMVRLP